MTERPDIDAIEKRWSRQTWVDARETVLVLVARVRELEAELSVCHGARNKNGDRCAELEAEVARLRGSLQEIAKRDGPFSRDRETHALNCIENMGKIADAALGIEQPAADREAREPYPSDGAPPYEAMR